MKGKILGMAFVEAEEEGEARIEIEGMHWKNSCFSHGRDDRSHV